MTIKIALAGEGGQGVQSVAEILAEAADQEGREAIYIPNFGVEQRGGVSIAYVQISDKKIGSPKFKTADIVIALSGRSIPRTAQYVDKNTVYVYDAAIEDHLDALPKNAKRVLRIPALEVAKNELNPRVFNVIILGAVIAATNVITPDQAKSALEAKLGHKFAQKPELRDLNYRAIERGIELVQQAE